jgi:hypothetical protein
MFWPGFGFNPWFGVGGFGRPGFGGAATPFLLGFLLADLAFWGW